MTGRKVVTDQGKRLNTMGTICLVVLFIILVGIGVSVYNHLNNKAACEEAGGVYHESACMDSKYFVDYKKGV